jgi:hypothetical protein
VVAAALEHLGEEPYDASRGSRGRRVRRRAVGDDLGGLLRVGSCRLLGEVGTDADLLHDEVAVGGNDDRLEAL